MTDRLRAAATGGLLAALLAACSPSAPTPPVPQVSFVGFFAPLRNCRARYQAVDARVQAASVGNAEYYRVPGFPYLRTDRLLATFGTEVRGINQVGGWVRHLRELDQEAREFEYENLGMTIQETAIQRDEFLDCGHGLASLELDNPEVYKRLLQTVTPPRDDSPGPLRRYLFGPLLQPLLRARVEARQAEIRRDFARPLSELLAPGQAPQSWTIKFSADPKLVPAKLDDIVTDELGLPGLFDSAWVAIAEANAPRLLLLGPDRLGTPRFDSTGSVGVDPSRPQASYQIGFTRFGNRVLIQIYYCFWLRPEAHNADSEGSPVDGLLWRVTLGLDMKPLAYDAIRTSGLDHLWFPAQPLARAPAGNEPQLLPQDGLAPPHVALIIDSHDQLRRVIDAAALPSTADHPYPLARYEDLYRLPGPGGTARDLFGPTGVMVGAPAPSSSLAVLTGIDQLGLPRHLSHLPAGLIERQAFDDARSLEAVFVPPKMPPAPPSPQATY